MPTLAEHRLLRLVTLTALYFAQGVPWGFVTVGYVVMLADLGVDNTTVGVALGWAYLPWSFKIAWGPLLDAVPALRVGRRRPFIVVSELLMGATLLALSYVDPRTSLGTIAILLFFNNTFASLQDVAVDGLAIDILDEHERGFANSLMWAGKSLGVVAGGGGALWLKSQTSWDTVFVTMACVIWAVMLLPLLLRERPPRDDDRAVDASLIRLLWFLIPISAAGVMIWQISEIDHWIVPVLRPFAVIAVVIAAWPLVDARGFRALRGAFSFATPWWGVAVGVLTPAGYALVQGIFTRLLRADLGLSDGDIEVLTGIVEPAAGVVGALIGGVLADRLGVRRTLALTMATIAGFLALWAASEAWWGNWWFVVGWDAGFNASIYAYNAASLGMFMSIASPHVSATHFAIYMAATNLTYAWTAPLGGVIADDWGYVALWGIAAVLQIVMILVLVPLDVDRAARVYASQAPR